MSDNIELPKLISRFVFSSVRTSFIYKGHKMFSAVYTNPNSKVKLTIYTFFDCSIDKQTFGVKVRGSKIRNIETFEKALEIAEEIIIGNESFLADE